MWFTCSRKFIIQFCLKKQYFFSSYQVSTQSTQSDRKQENGLACPYVCVPLKQSKYCTVILCKSDFLSKTSKVYPCITYIKMYIKNNSIIHSV